METVPARELARVAVAAAGLDRVRPFGSGSGAVRRTVEHLGYVQIDTISVVTRAHAHVLATRSPDFRERTLDRLLARRELFEYWAHAAAYLPMRDFRFALPRMRHLAAGGRHWANADPRTKREVLARIRAEGPLRARDFAAPAGHRGGWWSWKPAKAALERLFHEGALLVAGRDGFEKRFDLAERVLPPEVDLRVPTVEEQAAQRVEETRRSLGVFRPAQVTWLRRDPALRAAVRDALDAAVEDGRLRRVCPAGSPSATPWYADAARLEAGVRIARRARLLSPFDNLVIHRDRLAELFAFDYQLECYLPAPRRRHGYFTLPLLLGDRFVARADCRADRARGRLEIRNLVLEPDATPDPATLRPAFEELARREGCAAISVGRLGGVDGGQARALRSVLTGGVE
ncbi:MAG: crosslink repair DNA glycosylase YcaQ family protein [Pseudomonadales bacterium]|nr:crosslink repair DNA glycosylase YcaQ family protein [Pseudomonadales bacterium]